MPRVYYVYSIFIVLSNQHKMSTLAVKVHSKTEISPK